MIWDSGWDVSCNIFSLIAVSYTHLDVYKRQEEQEVTATAGGGAVSVTVNGKRELTNIVIQPEAVDPDDVEMLQDLIRCV